MQNTDKYILERTEYIATLYREIEQRVIYSIVDMIKRHGRVTGTTEINLRTLYEMGSLDTQTLELISNLTKQPLIELYKAIQDIPSVLVDYKELDLAYTRGVALRPPSEVKLDSILSNSKDFLRGEVELTQTRAVEYLNKDFKKIVDRALLETELGTMTEQQAVVSVVKEVAKQGITASTFKRGNSTVQMGLEPYMRRLIRTEFVQTSAKINVKLGQELGSEWYVTQHLGARHKGVGWENHEKWQGQVYNMQGLEQTCGYGDMLGLAGINCRHIMFPYFEGITVIPPKLDTTESNRVSELEHKQRGMERDIRDTKVEINALEGLGTPSALDEVRALKKKLSRQQKRIREHIKGNDDVLKRAYDKEKVVTRP